MSQNDGIRNVADIVKEMSFSQHSFKYRVALRPVAFPPDSEKYLGRHTSGMTKYLVDSIVAAYNRLSICEFFMQSAFHFSMHHSLRKLLGKIHACQAFVHSCGVAWKSHIKEAGRTVTIEKCSVENWAGGCVLQHHKESAHRGHAERWRTVRNALVNDSTLFQPAITQKCRLTFQTNVGGRSSRLLQSGAVVLSRRQEVQKGALKTSMLSTAHTAACGCLPFSCYRAVFLCWKKMACCAAEPTFISLFEKLKYFER